MENGRFSDYNPDMKRTLPLVLIAALSACAHSLEARREAADDIAARAGMRARVIAAGMFDLAAWERIGKPGAAARVYIEGDGKAWRTRFEKSVNPTPADPVALRLAAADVSDNVVYIARPCQYEGGAACTDSYWTEARTAPEVIAAFEKALDDIKARDGVTGFELVGYSGGAAVAVLAAAQRTDILSIRTVAGNLDYAAFSALHDTSAISASLAPEDVAMKIAHIPQLHFTGGEDAVVPEEIFEGWKKASDGAPCVQDTVVPGNDHQKGWDSGWAALLKITPHC
jgi:hypothetical protein